MKLLRTWIHFVCGWTASSLNSMRSVFYFIPTDPIRKTVADLGFFQDPIRSNCFSWKCKLREGTEQGDFEGLAKWPSLPHPRSNWANLESDYWKWNPTYVNEKIISACISLRMLVYTVIYVHIYISWEYIVERDEFEASFSKNDAGGWLNGSGNLICSPYVDIV